MRVKALGLGVAMMVLPLGYSSVASATTGDVFDFTSCHASSGCGPAGTVYGTVTLTQLGSSVDVSVALAGASYFVLTGAGDDQYFKFNDTGISATNIINAMASGLVGNGPLPALQGNQASTAGGFNGDDTGPFSFGISCTAAAGCGMGSSGPQFQHLTFTVTNTTLAALETNNGVTIFASDIAIGGIGSQTGPIDASVPVGSTPLPGAVWLFGSALAGGLGFSRWRNRRSGPVSVIA